MLIDPHLLSELVASGAISGDLAESESGSLNVAIDDVARVVEFDWRRGEQESALAFGMRVAAVTRFALPHSPIVPYHNDSSTLIETVERPAPKCSTLPTPGPPHFAG